MCNTFWSGLHQAIQIKGRAAELQIEKHADGMRQHFANQAMLKMPQVMHANALHGEAFG